jgi:broad specificity phosphatase PhoE
VSDERDVMGHAVLETPPATPKHVEVLIARHPEVQANIEGRYVGVGDSPFTERGERQCRELASYIAAWKPFSVHSSPRTRALAVAQLAAKEAGVEVHVDDDLAEIDFGAAEGLTYDQAKVAGVEIDLLGGPPENAPFHDGETWRAFAARIALAAERIENCGPRIAVVTHGGVVRAMLTYWLGLSPKSAWRFAVSNATVAHVTVWDGGGTLRSFGVDTSLCAPEAE